MVDGVIDEVAGGAIPARLLNSAAWAAIGSMVAGTLRTRRSSRNA